VSLAYGLWMMHHPSTRTFLSKVFADEATCARLPVDRMRQLAIFAVEVGTAIPRQVMQEIEEQTFAQDAKTPVAWRQAAWMCVSWRSAGDEAKAQVWAMKAYQRALGTA